MIKLERQYVDAIREMFEIIDFKFTQQNLRGIHGFIDPWFPSVEYGEKLLENLGNDYIPIYKMLMLGTKIQLSNLVYVIGERNVRLILESNIAKTDNHEIWLDGYSFIHYQQLIFMVDLNSLYDTCEDKYPNTYIGYDSFRLAENIDYARGTTVLDLCSGSGIQGILAARSADQVTCVDLNPIAVNISKFNVMLNQLEDKVTIENGDLYSALKSEKKYDKIYSNPPFIPMLEGFGYPICGDGGVDGLYVLRKIISGFDKYLNDNGEAIIFCQVLGDEKEAFFLNELNETLGDSYSYNAVLTDRLYLGYQNHSVSMLTNMITPEVNQQELMEKLKVVYDDMDAKYLYTLLLKVRKEESMSTYKSTIFRYYNDLHYEDKIRINDNLKVVKSSDDYKITTESEGDVLAEVDEDARKFFEYCKKSEGQATLLEIVDQMIKDNVIKLSQEVQFDREKYVIDALSMAKVLKRNKVVSTVI
jgi:cyclopropane fatty-acyl-phospholipid synthase-like methyltransferase